jgi:hypothetical protein
MKKKKSPWSYFVIGAFVYTALMNVALLYFSGIDKPINVRAYPSQNE